MMSNRIKRAHKPTSKYLNYCVEELGHNNRIEEVTQSSPTDSPKKRKHEDSEKDASKHSKLDKEVKIVPKTKVKSNWEIQSTASDANSRKTKVPESVDSHKNSEIGKSGGRSKPNEKFRKQPTKKGLDVGTSSPGTKKVMKQKSVVRTEGIPASNAGKKIKGASKRSLVNNEAIPREGEPIQASIAPKKKALEKTMKLTRTQAPRNSKQLSSQNSKSGSDRVVRDAGKALGPSNSQKAKGNQAKLDVRRALENFIMIGSQVANAISDSLKNNEEELLSKSSSFEKKCLNLVHQLAKSSSDIDEEDMEKLIKLLDEEQEERKAFRNVFLETVRTAHLTNMALYSQTLKMLKAL